MKFRKSLTRFFLSGNEDDAVAETEKDHQTIADIVDDPNIDNSANLISLIRSKSSEFRQTVIDQLKVLYIFYTK